MFLIPRSRLQVRVVNILCTAIKPAPPLLFFGSIDFSHFEFCAHKRTYDTKMAVPVERVGSGASHSVVELPPFRRVGSDESRYSNSSSSPTSAYRSFGDLDMYSGEKSTINLLSADEEIIEKWMISQVSV